jgi:hypothetical protein
MGGPKHNGPGKSGAIARQARRRQFSVADLNLPVDDATVLHRNRLFDEVAPAGGRIIADVPFRLIYMRSEGRRNSERQSGNSGSKKQIFHDTSFHWTEAVGIRCRLWRRGGCADQQVSDEVPGQHFRISFVGL